MSTDLTQQEAIDIWGPVNQQAAKAQAERGQFWKPANGDIEGEIVKVYTKLNFDKNGQNPAVDVTSNGKRYTVELAYAVIRDKVSELVPRVGDHLSITNPHKPAGKKYWDATVKVTRDGEDVASANATEPPF